MFTDAAGMGAELFFVAGEGQVKILRRLAQAHSLLPACMTACLYDCLPACLPAYSHLLLQLEWELSGPTVAGEGEVKILGRLARPRHADSVDPNDTHSE
jgi:hypothetical protein